MSIKIISENRKSRFNYTLTEFFEAGLVLKGTEVKSLRKHGCNIGDAYVSFQNYEAYLQKAVIPEYQMGHYSSHEPERLRKLLLHKREAEKIRVAAEEKGLTCVPTKVYFKNGMVKVEIALAKGKKVGDKRDTIKKRDADREISRALKKNR